MDFITCALSFIAGGLTYYLLYGGMKPGPFEQSLLYHLSLGKKVVVSIDEDCYIFEMNGNKMRVTRGVSTYMEDAPIEVTPEKAIEKGE